MGARTDSGPRQVTRVRRVASVAAPVAVEGPREPSGVSWTSTPSAASRSRTASASAKRRSWRAGVRSAEGELHEGADHRRPGPGPRPRPEWRARRPWPARRPGPGRARRTGGCRRSTPTARRRAPAPPSPWRPRRAPARRPETPPRGLGPPPAGAARSTAGGVSSALVPCRQGERGRPRRHRPADKAGGQRRPGRSRPRTAPLSSRCERPCARTVTPPWPTTSARRSSRSRCRAVCSSTPSTKAPSGSSRLQQRQALLAQVAEAGVVGAALGVVVVGDEGHVEAQRCEQVEARRPTRVPRPPCRSRRRGRSTTPSVRAAAEAKVTAPPGDSFSASRPGTRVPCPLPERVGRAAGPGEDERRGRQAGDHAVAAGALDIGAPSADRPPPARCPRCHGSRRRPAAHSSSALRLEAERRVEKDARARARTEPLDHGAVRLHHGRGRLARAHDGEQARRRRTAPRVPAARRGRQGVDDLPLEHAQVLVDGELVGAGVVRGHLPVSSVTSSWVPSSRRSTSTAPSHSLSSVVVDGGGVRRWRPACRGRGGGVEQRRPHHLAVFGLGVGVVGVGHREEAAGARLLAVHELRVPGWAAPAEGRARSPRARGGPFRGGRARTGLRRITLPAPWWPTARARGGGRRRARPAPGARADHRPALVVHVEHELGGLVAAVAEQLLEDVGHVATSS